MLEVIGNKQPVSVACLTITLLALALPSATLGESGERTSLNVVAKDAATGQPIYQARLTLRFREPRSGIKRSKFISYSAKTNAQGRYKFTNIPKGTIRLTVIADRHQTFGQDFELEQDNQVIEVKLKKPQPLL